MLFYFIYLGQYRQNGWSLRNRTNCKRKNGKNFVKNNFNLNPLPYELMPN